MSGTTRNILQSVQEREIIKQAPDADIYIGGQAYLTNPYLGSGTDPKGVVVPINDYFASFQVGYDIDNFIPSCSITLSVPIDQDYLFRTPGGNNLLKTMTEVRVFMKGYYLSERGNSMYYQVFRGYSSSISYTLEGKMTQITISCKGVMGLMQNMQIALNPSIMTAPMLEATTMASVQSNLSPYGMIADLFTRQWMMDGFEQYSVSQNRPDYSNPYEKDISGSLGIWNTLMVDIAKDVHIFGVRPISTTKNTLTKTPNAGDLSKEGRGHADAVVGTQAPSAEATEMKDYYELIREYLPDMSLSTLQLLNGRVVSRLERLIQIVNMIGFEGYQDVDGSIIVKPPLYNLDVTQAQNPASLLPGGKVIWTYSHNNPFIIELAEILSEQETEDEGAIRLTRMTARANLSPGFQIGGTEDFTSVSEEVDIPKLRQFGLRQESPHNCPWMVNSDRKGLYGFAVSELARANKGFRTYTVTIPARPELKLGFPLYFPHKDIYAYPKSISINYTQGSDTTMTIALDSMRGRPMFRRDHDVPAVPATDGAPAVPGYKTTLLTPQPNLVMRWTSQAPGQDHNTTVGDLSNTFATAPVPLRDIYKQQLQMFDYRTEKINNGFAPNNDDGNHAWRIQPDVLNIFSTNGGQGSKPRNLTSVDKPDKDIEPGEDYFKDLTTVRPYTDDKGYELIGPFPLGRWKTLQETVYRFTINGSPENGKEGKASSTAVAIASLSPATAFLFTGDAQTSSTPDVARQVEVATQAFSSVVANTKVFELTYDANGTSSMSQGMEGLLKSDASMVSSVAAISATEAQRAEAFLTNTPKPVNVTDVILQANKKALSEAKPVTGNGPIFAGSTTA